MRRSVLVLLLFLSGVTLPHAGEDFWKSITPKDYDAAGLGKLSPEERQRLGALVEAYRNNVPAAAPAAKPQTDVKVTMPTYEEETAPAKAANPGQSLLAKAKVLLTPGTQIEYQAIRDFIPGKFEGWEDHTVFTLSSGQRWQVANGGSYFTRPVENVAVEIVPAKLGGYWIEIPSLKTRVRVKQLSDK